MLGIPLMELHRIIEGQRDGLGKRQLHSLDLSVDVTRVRLMDLSPSAQIIALPYQLSITVSVTGELGISELWTSRGKPGNSSPMRHDLEASSELLSTHPAAPSNR
jgi:hypothetical protein